MHKIRLHSATEYRVLLERHQQHVNRLRQICSKIGEPVEGNCFCEHGRIDREASALESKQINLVSVARNAKHILEIGFNAGHSALLFLIANPNSRIVCVDLCEHRYTEPCFEYLTTCFPGRMTLVRGDSHRTVPQQAEALFDLVHIDGCHEPEAARLDFENSYPLATKFIVWDDTQIRELDSLLNEFISLGLVEEAQAHRTELYQHRIVITTNHQ